jgi:hypothetical protein
MPSRAPRSRAPKSRASAVLAGVLALVLAGVVAAAAIIELTAGGSGTAPPECRVTLGTATFSLSPDQANNATTIAAVGKSMGLPDHAVTVALAAAMQESQLHNLDHGDRDSLGLFQQRPSQGWGTPAEILTPSFAARSFFQHLAQITGWESLAVTDAAQRVQRSGAPSAYAQWETEARAVAQATTGEIPAGLACRAPTPTTSSGTALDQQLTAEVGTPALGTTLDPARGWTVASWLVGHSEQFGITSVSFGGQTWTPSAGAWEAGTGVSTQVRVQLARAS